MLLLEHYVSYYLSYMLYISFNYRFTLFLQTMENLTVTFLVRSNDNYGENYH